MDFKSTPLSPFASSEPLPPPVNVPRPAEHTPPVSPSHVPKAGAVPVVMPERPGLAMHRHSFAWLTSTSPMVARRKELRSSLSSNNVLALLAKAQQQATDTQSTGHEPQLMDSGTLKQLVIDEQAEEGLGDHEVTMAQDSDDDSDDIPIPRFHDHSHDHSPSLSRTRARSLTPPPSGEKDELVKPARRKAPVFPTFSIVAPSAPVFTLPAELLDHAVRDSAHRKFPVPSHLKDRPGGLSTAEARARLKTRQQLERLGNTKQSGPILFSAVRKTTPIWRLLWESITMRVSWMLVINLVLGISTQNWFNATALGILLSIHVFALTVQRATSERQLMKLSESFTPNANVLRDGLWQSVPATQLVHDDIILLREGDLVCANCQLVAGSLLLDPSRLSGETRTARARLPGRRIRAGCQVIMGEAFARVTPPVQKDKPSNLAQLLTPQTKTKRRTFSQRVARLCKALNLSCLFNPFVGPEEEDPKRKQANVNLSATRPASFTPPPHQARLIARVMGAQVTMVVLLSAATLGGVLIRGESVWTVLPLSFLLVAAAMPVALPLMLTLSLTQAARRLGRKGVLVTRLHAIADSATMDIFCYDKTGTITSLHWDVSQVQPIDATKVGGVAAAPKALFSLPALPELQPPPQLLTRHELLLIAAGGASDHSSRIERPDPLDMALQRALEAGRRPEEGKARFACRRVHAIPFSAFKRRSEMLVEVVPVDVMRLAMRSPSDDILESPRASKMNLSIQKPDRYGLRVVKGSTVTLLSLSKKHHFFGAIGCPCTKRALSPASPSTPTLLLPDQPNGCACPCVCPSAWPWRVGKQQGVFSSCQLESLCTALADLTAEVHLGGRTVVAVCAAPVGVMPTGMPADSAALSPKSAARRYAGLMPLGTLTMHNPLRPDSLPAFQLLGSLGVLPLMLTGDSAAVARDTVTDLGLKGEVINVAAERETAWQHASTLLRAINAYKPKDEHAPEPQPQPSPDEKAPSPFRGQLLPLPASSHTIQHLDSSVPTALQFGDSSEFVNSVTEPSTTVATDRPRAGSQLSMVSKRLASPRDEMATGLLHQMTGIQLGRRLDAFHLALPERFLHHTMNHRKHRKNKSFHLECPQCVLDAEKNQQSSVTFHSLAPNARASVSHAPSCSHPPLSPGHNHTRSEPSPRPAADAPGAHLEVSPAPQSSAPVVESVPLNDILPAESAGTKRPTKIARKVSWDLEAGAPERSTAMTVTSGTRTASAVDLAIRAMVIGGFAEMLPHEKELIIQLLQRRGHVTGMAGDGVNDAAALSQAEVGIAVPGASDVTKAAASVILTGVLEPPSPSAHVPRYTNQKPSILVGDGEVDMTLSRQRSGTSFQASRRNSRLQANTSRAADDTSPFLSAGRKLPAPAAAPSDARSGLTQLSLLIMEGRRLHACLETWIASKVERTFRVTGFVSLVYAVNGVLMLQPIHVVTMMFMLDLVLLISATDNNQSTFGGPSAPEPSSPTPALIRSPSSRRPSMEHIIDLEQGKASSLMHIPSVPDQFKTPSKFRVKKLAQVGLVLGFVGFLESLLLIAVGRLFLELDIPGPSQASKSAPGWDGSEPRPWHSFAFELLIFYGLFTMFSLHVRDSVWRSKVSRNLSLMALFEIAVTLGVCSYGIDFLFLPRISIVASLIALAWSAFWCLIVNDYLKVRIFNFFFRSYRNRLSTRPARLASASASTSVSSGSAAPLLRPPSADTA